MTTSLATRQPPAATRRGCWGLAGQAVNLQVLDDFIAGPLELAAQNPMLHPEARTEKAANLQATAKAMTRGAERDQVLQAFLRMLYGALIECCAKAQLGIRAGEAGQAWHYLMLAQRIRVKLEVFEALAGPGGPKLAESGAKVALAAKKKLAAQRRIDALPLLLQALSAHSQVAPSSKPSRLKIAQDMVDLAQKLPTRMDPELNESFAQQMLTELFKGPVWPPTDAQVRAEIAKLRRV